MNMSKKRYPDELKIEAVKQVVDAGHSVADVAGGLGMTTHSLYAWIRKFGPDSREQIAKSDDQVEIRRLKKKRKLPLPARSSTIPKTLVNTVL